jgi:MoxR-like ATPase
MNWRDFVLPEDIKEIWEKTLAHRLVLTYEAVADEVSGKDIIKEVFKKVSIV